ncbi:hypothetical protein [Zavarzinella formosa]|uniref:hypothetical protein n=1 Tax=Zavarzinella formosa TaxID=360055 RepID=UPI00031975E1|nr:hypothetical protein [Zavarzinella formosa]
MRGRALLLLLVAIPLQAEEAKPVANTVEISVSPAAPPVPALKIMFQPSLKELVPGNPVLGYLKCFMEQDNLYANKEVSEDREKMMAMPLAELKNFKPGTYNYGDLKYYGGVSSKNARRATRMETPDWNIVGEMQENGYNTLLPEIQKLRTLSKVVALKTRGEIMAGDFDEAATDITVILTLAKHLGEHPTYIGTLVGLAIAQTGLDRIAELIQQPKAPNLYWALSTLPQPLVRQERAVLGELMMSPVGLRNLTDPAKVWGKEEIQQAREFAAIVGSFDHLSKEKREEIDKWLKSRLKDKEWLDRARLDLVSPTRSGQMLEKYPPEQVVFLAIISKAEARQHESMKYAMLPFHQVQEQLMASEPNSEMPPEVAVTYSLSVWLRKPRVAQARLEQRIALLRSVEAVRLYAAANEGKLPPDLKATGVPVPLDPVTGGPIQYQVTDGKAVIHGAPPKGLEKDPTWIRYVVSVRK